MLNPVTPAVGSSAVAGGVSISAFVACDISNESAAGVGRPCCCLLKVGEDGTDMTKSRFKFLKSVQLSKLRVFLLVSSSSVLVDASVKVCIKPRQSPCMASHMFLRMNAPGRVQLYYSQISVDLDEIVL